MSPSRHTARTSETSTHQGRLRSDPIARATRALRIGWIGGISRQSVELERVAREEGHELLTHDGCITRRSVTALRALVARCDLVIVQTDVNSHGAMKVARDAARYYERPICLVRRASAADLRALLSQAA
jgi:hypothetical protein